MENATDALIMAGSVLLLIIALTVSISSLTGLRAQVQDITMARDQLQETKDANGYLNFITSETNDVRTVGVETIISSVRRIQKEQYTVYISLSQSIPDALLPVKIKTEKAQTYKVDYTSNKEKEIIPQNKEILCFTAKNGRYKNINNETISALYDALKNRDGSTKEFKEYIGRYQEKTSEGVSEANKETYKIITFVEQ